MHNVEDKKIKYTKNILLHDEYYVRAHTER